MYVVYAIGLDDYVGGYLSTSQAILKVGVSVHDVWYRLDANERFEGKNSYRALFKKIEVLGQKKFPTKAEAEAYEQALLQELGKKDLSIKEMVKGVTELRVLTPDRLRLVQEKLT
jgi:hypothetical protein